MKKRLHQTNDGQMIRQLKQEVADLETKLARKDEIVGEVMEEYVTLKKALGAVERAVNNCRNTGCDRGICHLY